MIVMEGGRGVGGGRGTEMRAGSTPPGMGKAFRRVCFQHIDSIEPACPDNDWTTASSTSRCRELQVHRFMNTVPHAATHATQTCTRARVQHA